MSGQVNIGEGPVPRTLAEADPILEPLLADGQVEPGPRLEAMAGTLWKRWPRDVGHSSVDPVGSDTSRGMSHDGSPLLQFGVVSDHLGEVLPFMAATAMAQGLVVHDPQSGTVYRPGGAVLGRRRALAQAGLACLTDGLQAAPNDLARRAAEANCRRFKDFVDAVVVD